MSFFGSGIPVLDPFNSSLFSIGVSLFIVVIASLNLVVDFDFIEAGAENGAPKYMEWYSAFGLMMTPSLVIFRNFKVAFQNSLSMRTTHQNLPRFLFLSLTGIK